MKKYCVYLGVKVHFDYKDDDCIEAHDWEEAVEIAKERARRYMESPNVYCSEGYEGYHSDDDIITLGVYEAEDDAYEIGGDENE